MRRKTATIFLGLSIATSQLLRAQSSVIDPAPQDVTIVKEIALNYPPHLAKLYEELTPQERVFSYYMYRASLPGNRIATDQSHRHALEIQKILEFILANKEKLSDEQFLTDVTQYLVYVWTNHGQYFMREKSNQKRTPARLGLTELTEENLLSALVKLNYPNAQMTVNRIAPSMFDDLYEPTSTVPDSIAKSASNIYSNTFTDEDFTKLSAEDQQRLNAYCYIEMQNGMRIPRCQLYKVGGKYDKELQTSLKWLEKAHSYARMYPEQFDEQLVKSLEYLCEFIKTGDEEMFKKHSIAWLKSNSRLDYCWGFIETYDDPKGYRGSFQAEVSIKSLDINTLNAILPKIEAELPLPEEFKRENLLSGTAALPNASINTKIFSVGHLGPLNITAAYCLPNYQEIRSQYGSKQIIYHSVKKIAEILNADMSHRLFNLPNHYEWLCKHDPQFMLNDDITNLSTILHETLGHGSGKFTTHRFREGDNFTIEGITYAVGDEISVTSGNIEQFLAGYGATMEELRAEILALLSVVSNYDDLAASGIMGDWPQKIEKDKMIELFINAMANRGLLRLLLQQDNATEIAGDHARANTTIMNYLIDHGGVAIKSETITIDGKSHTVLATEVIDLERASQVVVELANLVQMLRSTGDTQGVRSLIETYGKPIRHPEHLSLMKENMRSCVGEIKVQGSLFPDFTPILDVSSGEILDVQATWPTNIVEQFMEYRKLHQER